MRRPDVSGLTLILIYLAGIKEDQKRTVYWIRKITGLGKQTIYDNLYKLKEFNSIIEKEAGISRAKKTIKQYYLTDYGWYRVSTFPQSTIELAKNRIKKVPFHLSDPIETARNQIGDSAYDEFRKKGEMVVKGRIDLLLETIRNVLTTRKGTPGYYFKLDIWADEYGRIRYKTQAGNENLREEIKESRKYHKRMRKLSLKTEKNGS